MMETTRLFDDVVPRLQPSVPGCPHATILDHVRRAAIRACEQTLMWRRQMPLYVLLPGVAGYQYRALEGAVVHAVFAATVNDRHLERLTLEQALDKYPQWANMYCGDAAVGLWAEIPANMYAANPYNAGQYNGQPLDPPPSCTLDGAGTPQAFCQLTPDRYIILPAPDDRAAYQMRITQALKPSCDAVGMNAQVLCELEDIITHAALQQLLLIPEVPWTNAQLAEYHARQYTFHTAERRARANLGNARGTFRARMQPFGV
jgi:hypothetical protein